MRRCAREDLQTRAVGAPWRKLLAGLLVLLAAPIPALSGQDPEHYAFGVLNQRSLTLTAEYWNPILTYVERKSGVRLTLRVARTANETTDMAGRHDLAFMYTNHMFTPERDKLGWTVLARQEGDGIRGQLVVPAGSTVRALKDLAGKEVAFPNPYGFAGYFIPYDALLRAGVKVKPIFAGTQEAAMGQMKHGVVAAAGVNSQVMSDFARRENFEYRILYDSEAYFDLCIMAHPKVPAAVRTAVRQAFVGMKADVEGQKVLSAAARVFGSDKARGFVAASDADYDNYRAFYRDTVVPIDKR